MKLQKFYEILKGLETAIEEMTSLAEQKQSALVKNNHDEIEKISLNEQKTLQKINNLERERIEELKMIGSEYGIEEKYYRLEELINQLGRFYGKETIELLTSLRTGIKSKIKKLRRINNQNKTLIDNSRFFIKQIITKVRGSKNNFILNAKV